MIQPASLEDLTWLSPDERGELDELFHVLPPMAFRELLDQIASERFSSDQSSQAAFAYERHKATMRERQRRMTRSGQDIGPIPWDTIDWERRIACSKDILLFAKTYLADVFGLPWARYHRDLADGMNATVETGDNLAIGLPRGGGKTSLLTAGCIAHVLYGRVRFPLIVGPVDDDAIEILEEIIKNLTTNPLLLEDFPEVCYPMAMLDGESKLQSGQRCRGERTRIEFSEKKPKKLVLPTIQVREGDPIPEEHLPLVCDEEGYTVASGSCVQAASILSKRLRGRAHVTSRRQKFRVDWIFCNDVQTTDGAKSPPQVKKIMEKVDKDLGWSGGPTSVAPLLFALTVIAENDVADQLLNPELHPEYNGIRRRMLTRMPDDMETVEAYIEHCLEVERNVPKSKRAAARNEFYLEHREQLEAGAESSWPQRYDANRMGELSAIQHAYHLMAFKGMDSFYCEGQQEPNKAGKEASVRCKPKQIKSKQHETTAGIVPTRFRLQTEFATDEDREQYRPPRLAIAIDVQHESLWWTAGVCSQDFEVAILANGIYPEQPRRYVRRDKLPVRLSHLHPDLEVEDRIRVALMRLIGELSTREWEIDGGGTMTADMIVGDAREGTLTRPIGKAFREADAPSSCKVIPFMGYGIGADKKPMLEYRVGDGETNGFHWFEGRIAALGQQNVFKVDKYFWQTEAHRMFRTELGKSGSLSLPNDHEHNHDLYADHLVSEYDSIHEVRKGDIVRVTRVWRPVVAQCYNEFFDTTAAMLACFSRLGCKWPNVHIWEEPKPDPKPAGPVIRYVDFS